MGNYYLSIILLVFVLAILIIASILFRRKYPYYKNPFFISLAERAFFSALQQATENRYFIFPQVSLNRLVKVDKQGKEYWRYFDKISQKSVDFVLADKSNFNPILVIELDDMSHYRPGRMERDVLVNEALKAAGIPALRVPNRRAYDTGELRSLIEASIKSENNK